MKPDSITIPVTLTFDPAGQELAELARHIVTRLTDEGALDEAAEHGHGIMATSAAIEWARERLGNQIPALPCPTCGGEHGRYVHAPPYPDDPDGLRWVVCPDCTLIDLDERNVDLARAAGLEPQTIARPDGLVVDAGQGFE